MQVKLYTIVWGGSTLVDAHLARVVSYEVGFYGGDLNLLDAINQKANQTALTAHTNSVSNPHLVTKAQIGLSLVDNTSDSSKPVSTAVQTALNSKANTTHVHAISDVTNLQTTLDGKQASGSYAASSHVHSAATTTVAGFLSTADKTKLDGVAAGAEVNVNADWTASTGDAVILNKPSTFAPSTHGHAISDVTNLQTTLDGKQASGSYSTTSHVHGNITSAGAIGATANRPVITTTGGALTTGTFGTAANTFCQGDDSRLSNARTPTAHVHAISDVTNLQTTLDGKQASGSYATLVSGTVPATQLPSYVDDVLEFANLAAVTANVPGEAGKIYVTVDTNKTYRWSGSTYVEISASPGSTDAVPEGSTNLYFTNARVIAAAPPANLNYQSAIADTVVSTQVGGAVPQAASVWKARTLSQALDTVLFPTVLPFISTAKSAGLTVSGTTGIQEVGSLVARTLTASFNRGRITNGDGNPGPDLVGAAISFSYSGTGISTFPTPSTNPSLGSIAVILGSNQWSVTVSHAAGTLDYYDNKSVASTVLNGSRLSGAVSASTSAFTGVYPWYYIKSPVTFTAAQFGAAITALGGNTSGAAAGISGATVTRVLASANGTLVVPYNVSNQFFGVAYDNGYTSKTAFFVSSLNSGDITGPFNTNSQSGVNQAATTPLWTNRTFTVHISKNPLTDAAANIELRNL